MEYHFTGTEDSPDFTLIADAIVDGLGNRIYYSSIKDIKVKRKGTTSVLRIISVVDGRKIEHRYSVRKEDEAKLKAAIAGIGSYLSITHKKNFKSFFNRKTLGLTVVIAVFCCGGIGMYRSNQERTKEEALVQLQNELPAQKEEAINKVVEIAESYGICDISVELRTEDNNGQDKYYADITCSNWGKFTSYEMLSIYQKINTDVQKNGLKIGTGSSVFLGNIYSNNNTYTITLGSNGSKSTIKRNDKIIYEIAAKMKSSGSKSNTTTTHRGNSADNSSNVSQEYKNALSKGLQYARMNMSKKAIYEQLVSSYGEGFPADAAQYAVDHMTGVDWNANALAKAKQYYYSMSMSKSAVYDQLTSSYGEQFTASQAQYAIDHLD